MIALMFFGRLEHVMIRKDWYKTVVIEAKESAGQLKRIRDVLSEYDTEITDFDARHSEDGANMILKVGLKLSTALHNAELIQDISGLEGVKSVKWEAE